MPRKVFISFLGISNYASTRYGTSTDIPTTLPETRFVQEAIARKYCSKFGEEDRIFILTTEMALKNWEDGEHVNWKSKETKFHHGLEHQLVELDLNCSISNVDVPSGENTDEIWRIFQITFDLLNEGDRVYFDITHGFRSLPMLSIVLLNYAKFLKGIIVEGIYYGAYENRAEQDGIEVAPIWDLTDFAKLQDWANNANVFLNTGNAFSLTEQIQGYEYRAIKEGLENFTNMTFGNRGMDIFEGKVMVGLKEALSKPINPSDPAYRALNPILAKIKTQFDEYEDKSVFNGFLAARWCIQNGLVQQAATILEEFVISFVLVEIGYTTEMQNSSVRTFVSAAVTTSPDNFDKTRFHGLPAEFDMDIALEAINNLPNKKKLGKALNQLKNSIRNDISHAGFRPNPRTFDSFKGSLVKRYNELRRYFKSSHDKDLPAL